MRDGMGIGSGMMVVHIRTGIANERQAEGIIG